MNCFYLAIFYNKFNVILKLFNTLLHDDIFLEWIPDLDKVINKITIFLA